MRRTSVSCTDTNRLVRFAHNYMRVHNDHRTVGEAFAERERGEAVRAAKRIQRKRIRGWRMPPGAIYVGRPSIYANPVDWRTVGRIAAVEDFRRQLINWRQDDLPGFQEVLDTLKGRDLACWCPLVDGDGNPAPCHADVWLEFANGG